MNAEKMRRAMAAVLFSAVPVLTFGQGLLGSEVTATLLYPTINAIVAGPVPALVGPAVEFPGGSILSGRNFSIDVSESQIFYLPGENVGYGAAEFNGFGLSFVGAPPISSVTIDGSSTFTPASISWNADTVYFDLASLAVSSGDQIVLNVSLVPELEPTWLMLAGGLFLTFAVPRRARRTK